MIIGDAMAKCPKCGREIDMPYRTWSIKPKSVNRKNTPKLSVKWFSCICGNRFRVVEKCQE